MNRFTFENINLNNQRPRVDRFVPPRDSFPEMRRRTSLEDSCEPQACDIWCRKYLQKKKYTNYLEEAFGLKPLKFQESNSMQTNEEHYVQLWPCIPRKRKYLSSANSILDLPNYSYAPYPELLDWNNGNILVAALGSNYHKWSWRTQSLISDGHTQHGIQCCKFDPRGELLVLGTEWFVELHDNTLSKMIRVNACQCHELDKIICSITAVDWSPTGNSFVTGCSRGVITSFDRTARPISASKLPRKPITLVRVSPNARHVAAVTLNSSVVLVYTWPTFETFLSLDSVWTVTSISWHPWRSALLGVGDGSARITFWDIPKAKNWEASVGGEHSKLDAMLFSHKTGELVLSLCGSDSPAINLKSRLLVMSDLYTVVDQWGDGENGMDHVRTMVLSPDGTKLATATADEDLLIWNFLPDDSLKKNKNTLRRHSSLPVFLDEATKGFSLR